MWCDKFFVKLCPLKLDATQGFWFCMYRDVVCNEDKLLERLSSASVNNQCLLHVGSAVFDHKEYFIPRLLNNTEHYIPVKFWRMRSRSKPELSGNFDWGLTACYHRATPAPRELCYALPVGFTEPSCAGCYLLKYQKRRALEPWDGTEGNQLRLPEENQDGKLCQKLRIEDKRSQTAGQRPGSNQQPRCNFMLSERL